MLSYFVSIEYRETYLVSGARRFQSLSTSYAPRRPTKEEAHNICPFLLAPSLQGNGRQSMSETMYAGSSGTVARTRYIAFSNTFLKPPKTVQEDNGRPDGDINKNLSGASTSGKGILLRYSKYCCRTLDRESLKGISLSILFFVFRIMMQFLLKSTSRFLMDMASPILIPVAYKILYKAGNAKDYNIYYDYASFACRKLQRCPASVHG